MTNLTPRDIAALKKEIFSSLHCVLPGIVESFDPAVQTASVRPALRKGGFSLPAIRDVPVFFPGSRESGITWPVSAGDECLLVFADCDLDAWFEGGEAGEPASARQHALPDAFAFVGFRSRGNALADFERGPDRFACRQLSLLSANGLVTGTGVPGQAGSSSVTYIPARWIFGLPFSPVPGDMITVEIPVAGVNAGVWLSADGGESFLPVAVNGTSRLTTHYAPGHIVTLVYEEGLNTTVYPLEGGTAGETWSGPRWCVLNYYDSNTTYTNASLGQGYGTCTTAAATAAKAVTLGSYALTVGGYVAVKFTYAMPASATLNVNSRGAKPVWYMGAAIPAGIIRAGDTATFVYDGSRYHLVSVDRQDHDDRYYTEPETDALLAGKKNVQAAVADPAASGTSLEFISALSQDAQGVISPAKKSVKVANNLTTAASGSVLDARQGKALKDAVDAVDGKIFTPVFKGNNFSEASLANNTVTNLGSVTLDKGLYLLFGSATFAANARGERRLIFANTDTGASSDRYSVISAGASPDGATQLQLCWVANVTAATATVYLNARQTSGGALGVTHPGIRQIRLS